MRSHWPWLLSIGSSLTNKHRRCYDACQSMTYTVPPCSLSASWSMPALTSANATATQVVRIGTFSKTPDVATTPVQTSSLVAVASSRASSHLDGLSIDANVATLFPAPGFVPSSRSSKFNQSLPSPARNAESSPVVAAPSVTAAPQLAVVKAALNRSDYTGSVPPIQATSKVCGKKTNCYDYITSMNAACPAVRYGG
jgi:hypothetical protein